MTLSSNCAPTATISPTLLPAGCTAFKNGLTLKSDLPYEEWMSVGKRLSEVAGAVMWMLGDWLAYGDLHYLKSKWSNRVPNGLYDQVAKETGFAEGTLRNAKHVCAALPLSRRRDKLTFGHAQEIVGRAPKDQHEFWIEKVIREGLSIKKMREMIRKAGAIYAEEPNDKGVITILEAARQYARDLGATEVTPALAAEILKILAPPLRKLTAASKAA